MKPSLFCAVLVIAPLGYLHGQTGVPLPVTITISAPKVIAAGSNISLKIEMKNISDQPVDDSTYYVGCSNRRFRIDVRDESGHAMKKEALHPETMPGSFASSTLAPGESVVQEDCVSWHNDISHPGTYTIQASRVISNDERNGLVKSNIITITVLPADEPTPK